MSGCLVLVSTREKVSSARERSIYFNRDMLFIALSMFILM